MYTNKFTLVHVRIITGRRHQIRVHMHHFCKELGDRTGQGEDFEIVSDFQYLERSTSEADKAICERVFLHECKLGMVDPENLKKNVRRVGSTTRIGFMLTETYTT